MATICHAFAFIAKPYLFVGSIPFSGPGIAGDFYSMITNIAGVDTRCVVNTHNMQPALSHHRGRIVSIIAKSFHENPTIRFLLGGNHAFDTRLQQFARYVYHMAQSRQGLFLSENHMGLMVLYPNDIRAQWWDACQAYYYLLQGISKDRIAQIHRHVNHVASIRPKDRKHLYCWFFGVDPDEHPRRSAWEIKNAIVEASRTSGLPVYAETAVARNKVVYERFGFETYHYWKNPENGIEVWFLKREPGTL